MRTNRQLTIAAVLGLALLARAVHAQQPYWQQVRDRAPARPAVDPGNRGADLLRPYGTRGEGRGFTAEAVPRRIKPVRSSYQEPRRDYFPGLRTGQGANRNVTGALCVPGRRAFIMR